MEKFDLARIKAAGYEQREKNVFYEKPEFKIRIINLKPDSEIPSCVMSSYVIFICLEGKAEVLVNGNKVDLSSGELIVSEPATFSMRSVSGARLLGIQVRPQSV
jgi:quercetin dioxygenase-like cupin family protein